LFVTDWIVYGGIIIFAYESEEVTFGIYIRLFYSPVSAYGRYAVYPISYSLAFQWFIFGLVQAVIFGIAVAIIYKPKLTAG
jgi:ABC-type multidrug transport system permease subunit